MANGQGYIRTYPQANAQYGFYGISRLNEGHALLHGISGPLGNHTRNMRVDAYGNPVWILDYQHLTTEYTLGRVSIGDSLFFDAGITSTNPQVMADPFLMCYDAQGRLRWFRQYESPAYDEFSGLARGMGGKFYTVGKFEDSIGTTHSFVMRLDGDGDSIWRKEYLSTTSNGIYTSGVVGLPNGDLIFSLLYKYQPDGYHLIRLDSLGNVLFDRPYIDNWLDDPFQNIQLCPNGNLLCQGRDSTIREYTPAGDLIRDFRSEDALYGVTQLVDGGLLLYGPPTIPDFFLLKLNSDWTFAWRNHYDLLDENEIHQVLELPSREILLAGSRSTSFFLSGEGLLLRTDCEGNLTDYTHCLPPGPEYALWPNPSDGHATLSIPEAFYGQPHTIQVFNALGQVLFSQRVDQMQFLDLDLGEVSPGVVFLRVSRAGEAVWQRPWLIQR